MKLQTLFILSFALLFAACGTQEEQSSLGTSQHALTSGQEALAIQSASGKVSVYEKSGTSWKLHKSITENKTTGSVCYGDGLLGVVNGARNQSSTLYTLPSLTLQKRVTLSQSGSCTIFKGEAYFIDYGAGKIVRVKGTQATTIDVSSTCRFPARCVPHKGKLFCTCSVKVGSLFEFDPATNKAKTLAIGGPFNPNGLTSDGTHFYIAARNIIIKYDPAQQKVVKTQSLSGTPTLLCSNSSVLAGVTSYSVMFFNKTTLAKTKEPFLTNAFDCAIDSQNRIHVAVTNTGNNVEIYSAAGAKLSTLNIGNIGASAITTFTYTTPTTEQPTEPPPTDGGPGDSPPPDKECTASATRPCYNGPAGTQKKGECKDGTQTCTAQGTWGPCLNATLPKTEVCNGKDDNCDGNVDNGITCSCSKGKTEACYSGPANTRGKGECKDGLRTCIDDGQGGTKWTACTNDKKPTTELCDGKDNDCDGMPDNGFDVGASCSVGKGECTSNGKKICDPQNAQTTKCNATPGTPKTEVCNKKDDDCDGNIDNGVTGCCTPKTKEKCYNGANGTENKGECKNGERTCDDKGVWSACVGEVVPTKELCNLKDDDCDGTIDNGFPNLGKECPVGVGICKTKGKYVCGTNGSLSCKGTPLQPKPLELCNGLDDNCNGKIDENVTDKACKTTCESGTQSCKNGQWSECSARKPAKSETCGNKIDDDCNGSVDDGCKEACTWNPVVKVLKAKNLGVPTITCNRSVLKGTVKVDVSTVVCPAEKECEIHVQPSKFEAAKMRFRWKGCYQVAGTSTSPCEFKAGNDIIAKESAVDGGKKVKKVIISNEFTFKRDEKLVKGRLDLLFQGTGVQQSILNKEEVKVRVYKDDILVRLTLGEGKNAEEYFYPMTADPRRGISEYIFNITKRPSRDEFDPDTTKRAENPIPDAGPPQVGCPGCSIGPSHPLPGDTLSWIIVALFLLFQGRRKKPTAC